MENDTSRDNIFYRFYPVENRSIIPTLLFGFLIFLFRSIYQMVHFDPFSPSFIWHSLFYYFFIQSWIPVIIFSVVLHYKNNKIGKIIAVLLICAIASIVILVSTIYTGEEAGFVFVDIVQFYLLAGIVACFLGFLARGIVNSTPSALKVFLIVIALLVFPALTAFDYVVYSNPSMLTESRCHLLGPFAQIECFDKLARTTNNPIFCEGAYGNSATVEKCYNDITTELSNKGNLDVVSCLSIPVHSGVMGERDGCVNRIAQKLDNVNKCESLTDSELRFRCIGGVSSTFVKLDAKTRLTKCTSLKDKGDEVSCFFSIRHSFYNTEYYDKWTGDLSQCALLSGTSKDLCYYANTLGILPKPSCSMITDSEIKRKCEIHGGPNPRTTDEAY